MSTDEATYSHYYHALQIVGKTSESAFSILDRITYDNAPDHPIRLRDKIAFTYERTKKAQEVQSGFHIALSRSNTIHG